MAVPDVMFLPVLLYFGMGYIHSQNHSVMSKPLLRRIDKLLRFADDEASPLSPRLLQGRAKAPNALDSILNIVDPDFRAQFNLVNNNRAYADDWFNERKFELAKGALPAPTDSVLWSEVLAHEQRWLDTSTRLALLNLISSVDWTALNTQSEATAICALMLAVDMIAYVQDESTATEITNNLLGACMSAVPLSESDLDGTDKDSPFNFQRAITEVAYRVARSIDMGRSCRLLASTLRTIADREVSLRTRIVELLDAAIPMLPVENVLPLVILRRSLRRNC